MAPVEAQNVAIPGAIVPKWEKNCLRSGRIAVQNFTPIGKASAEKSVTVDTKNKEMNSKLGIQPCTTYGGIITLYHLETNYRL